MLELIDRARRITVLTGAGVSTQSGIPDFAQLDATWPYPESRNELLSLPYFLQEPENFWKVYREVFGQSRQARPNLFHQWLAELQDDKRVTVVTQNVDGLHSLAGSKDVLELHGSNTEVICTRLGSQGCGKVLPSLWAFNHDLIPVCKDCSLPLKPNVSLFFEGVNHMAEAREAVRESDLFIIAGTALAVAPANELPWIAEFAEPVIPTLWINTAPSVGEYTFTREYRGDAVSFVQDL